LDRSEGLRGAEIKAVRGFLGSVTEKPDSGLTGVTSHAGFATAGGKQISISKEAVARAKILFEDTFTTPPIGPARPNVAAPDGRAGKMSSDVSEAVKAEGNNILRDISNSGGGGHVGPCGGLEQHDASSPSSHDNSIVRYFPL
jgi:hypothetical protein